MNRTTLALALLLVAQACAAPPPPRVQKPRPVPVVAERPVCSAETAFGQDQPPHVRTFPAQNWFVLMLHAYRSNGEIARPLNDCSGVPVTVDSDGCPGEPPPRFTPTELTAEDLIVTPLGDNRRLVWVMTERLSDGQAQGPVAIAEVVPRGILVTALGTLRAFPHNATLRLERLGGMTVLVADGERCENPNDAATCDRGIRVVPLIGQRFITTPLLDSHNACLGSSLITMRARGRGVRIHDAKYELDASVTFTPNAITVREQLALTHTTAARAAGAKDGAGESFVTRQQVERHIALRNGWLISDGASVLGRWLASQQALERRAESRE